MGLFPLITKQSGCQVFNSGGNRRLAVRRCPAKARSIDRRLPPLAVHCAATQTSGFRGHATRANRLDGLLKTQRQDQPNLKIRRPPTSASWKKRKWGFGFSNLFAWNKMFWRYRSGGTVPPPLQRYPPPDLMQMMHHLP